MLCAHVCVCGGGCSGIMNFNQGPFACTQDVPEPQLATPQEVQIKPSLDHSPSLGTAGFGAF